MSSQQNYHEDSKSKDEYISGAKDMLAWILRGSRPFGYRIVCGLEQCDKEKMAEDLLESFFEFNACTTDVTQDAKAMAQYSIDVRNNLLALIGDILPADFNPIGKK